MRRLLLAALLLICVVSPALAFEPPPLRGHVNDSADMIPAATEAKLEQYLTRLEQSDSTQVVILTVPDIDGDDIDSAAIATAQQWGLGQEGKDNGVLLFIAKQERKVRIEVGYGLEGVLTDLLAGRIIDNEIVPRFKQGDFSGGIVAGTMAIVDAVHGQYKGSGKRHRKGHALGWLPIVLFLLLGVLPRRRRSLFWFGGFGGMGGFGGGGGGFGGGGFSGGGGGFGGGGASGGW